MFLRNRQRSELSDSGSEGSSPRFKSHTLQSTVRLGTSWLGQVKGYALVLRMALLSFVVYFMTFLFYRVFVNSAPFPERVFNAKGTVSIIVNTFHRPDMLFPALEYYSECSAVSDIHVVWHELESPPQLDEGSYKGKVVFHPFEGTSLNDRFAVLPVLHDAVFSVDDDIRVDCQNLYMLFEVWRTSQDSIVGFVPRSHSEYTVDAPKDPKDPSSPIVRRTRYLYSCFWRVWMYSEYSMVLSKVAMFHKKFLDVYTNKTPKSVHVFVDDQLNCEDIAFQFAVSNWTNLPPVYVRGSYSDQGGVGGISSRGSHWDSRSSCIDALVDIYEKMPLVNSHHIVVPASWGMYVKPSFWYEYISTDWMRRLIGV